MHRSGTSMVAEILRGAGVYLGADEALLPASEFNPHGLFEHRDFVLLNDEILTSLGGAWDRPPTIWLPWARRRLEPLREKARALVDEMGRQRQWGWKDPRNSLTLPFWRTVVPDLRLVICVREPGSVAHSLAARGGHSLQFGITLWAEYNRRLLRLARRATVVTVYESYISDREREVTRLLDRLDLPITAAAMAAVDPALRRQESAPGVLPRDVARLRSRLYRLAADQAST
jgi:hypothetical protein